MKRYITEKNAKIITVCDSLHPRYKPNISFMAHEEPWILAHWVEAVFDTIQQEFIAKADTLCKILNEGEEAIKLLRVNRMGDTEETYHPKINEHATGDPYDEGEKIDESKETTDSD